MDLLQRVKIMNIPFLGNIWSVTDDKITEAQKSSEEDVVGVAQLGEKDDHAAEQPTVLENQPMIAIPEPLSPSSEVNEIDSATSSMSPLPINSKRNGSRRSQRTSRQLKSSRVFIMSEPKDKRFDGRRAKNYLEDVSLHFPFMPMEKDLLPQYIEDKITEIGCQMDSEAYG